MVDEGVAFLLDLSDVVCDLVRGRRVGEAVAPNFGVGTMVFVWGSGCAAVAFT